MSHNNLSSLALIVTSPTIYKDGILEKDTRPEPCLICGETKSCYISNPNAWQNLCEECFPYVATMVRKMLSDDYKSLNDFINHKLALSVDDEAVSVGTPQNVVQHEPQRDFKASETNDQRYVIIESRNTKG